MTPDCELLRLFADKGDEAAFAEVVRRHTDLVYSAALRLLAGDTHLAQDVTQTVFTTMARKAGALSRHASLLGWLHTTARYAASVAVRGEQRRRAREQEAFIMHHDPTPSHAEWAQLRPILDEAVGGLRATDREAVLLRFFQGKSHREVGAVLGLNQDTARKRVDRALEKMRAHFLRRGVTVSSALLATTLTAHSVQAAPTGLATTLGATSLANAAQTGVAGSFLKGITMTTKSKTILAAAAVLALAAIPAALQSRQMTQTDAQNYALAKQNATLQAQVFQLGTRLLKIKDGTPVGLAPAITMDATDYIPVSKEALKSLHFGLSGQNFELFYLAIDLLNITPAEARRLQDTLTEIKKAIQIHERDTVHEVAPDQVTDQNVLNYLKENPGRQTVYEIPRLSEEERTAIQQQLADSIISTLGPDRGDILTPSIYQDGGPGYLGVRHVFAFSDSLAADGQTPKAVGEEFSYNSSNGTGGAGMLFSDGLDIHAREITPPEWYFLIKALRSRTRPIAPPPEPSLRYKAVLGNLREIRFMAGFYMQEYKVSQVTYRQLITAPAVGAEMPVVANAGPIVKPAGSDDGAYMKPVTPVAGESYDSIVVHQTDKSISLDVPGVGLVKDDF